MTDTVPRRAPGGLPVVSRRHGLRLMSDAGLVALVRAGETHAFQAIYERHQAAVMSFCRYLLADAQEAEDVVQHTFLAAYCDLISSEKPILLRAWLMAISRNRCLTLLRARREHPVAELVEPAAEALALEVQRRQDLRELVDDLQALPRDQRLALVLTEMEALGHDQIAPLLGVPRSKVKALVFQARESLQAMRAARETDCGEIRRQLSAGRGATLRRSNLRHHLHGCAACRDYRGQVQRLRHPVGIRVPDLEPAGPRAVPSEHASAAGRSE